MKHVNAEMIKAVADNTELVIFFRQEGVCRWSTANIHLLIRDPEYREFFLCLPQHKEACLHWLSGGSVQYRIALDVWTDAAGNVSNAAWTPDNLFIDDQVEFKIKPKKERRWIGTCKNFVTSLNYPSIDECKDAVGDDTSWQFHEIEVEV